MRILLVLGSSISSNGIRRILAKEPETEVVEDVTQTGSDVFAALAAVEPDVVLVDRDLPGEDGIAVVAEVVRSTGRRAPWTLVLADAYRRGDAARAARAGARGYLIKNQEAWTLGAALKAVAGGEAWLSPQAAGELLEEFRGGRPGRREPRGATPLTERERGVIRLIAYGCSNLEVARELGVSESTVKTHVSRILAKLDLRSRTQLAAFARDLGIA
ncbi:LuxR C-terminal-related transcriptional regulator [Amycolatopsis sp. NPDC059027]|uniref:LuxR C-terminal-related transcriptional regulator n=1 Tax=unclassified Amycolatopsis TaxID=2618356 RepID=UPI003671C5ED